MAEINHHLAFLDAGRRMELINGIARKPGNHGYVVIGQSGELHLLIAPGSLASLHLRKASRLRSSRLGSPKLPVGITRAAFYFP